MEVSKMNAILLINITIAFLIGSVPTGYLIAKKVKEIDIRTKGSGNIGSTNIRRVLGKKLSLITQVIDLSKGLIPVALCPILYYKLNINIEYSTYISIIALSTILGHNFTPFLKFKGGKGVNTTIGAFFVISPASILVGVLTYFSLRCITKIVSVRSIALGITIPITCYFTKEDFPILLASIISCLMIIARHKSNIVRLLNKTEK